MLSVLLLDKKNQTSRFEVAPELTLRTSIADASWHATLTFLLLRMLCYPVTFLFFWLRNALNFLHAFFYSFHMAILKDSRLRL